MGFNSSFKGLTKLLTDLATGIQDTPVCQKKDIQPKRIHSKFYCYVCLLPTHRALAPCGSAGFLSTPHLSVCTSEAAFICLYPHRQLYVGPTMKITRVLHNKTGDSIWRLFQNYRTKWDVPLAWLCNVILCLRHRYLSIRRNIQEALNI